MRYIWLIFLALFIIFSTIFAYQNQDPIALRFHLTWINIHIGFAARPVFIPIFISLAFGILLTALYLLGSHTRLRVQLRMQNSEIYRLKKMVLLERNKHQKLQQKRSPLPPPSEPPSSFQEDSNSSAEQANLLVSQSEAPEVASPKP